MSDTTDTIFFMHIPKTAGTSVRHSAIEYFGEDRAMLLYGDGAKSTSLPLQERFFGTWSHLNQTQRFQMLSDYLVENRIPFFSSHARLDQLPCFVPGRAFAIFREPVARVVSHYRQHLKRHPWLPIEEFIELPVQQNVQFRTLGKTALEQIGIIGLQNQFEETLARVNRFFQIELSVAKMNTSPLVAQIKNRFLSQDLLERIEKLNDKDMDLYERARKRFAEQA